MKALKFREETRLIGGVTCEFFEILAVSLEFLFFFVFVKLCKESDSGRL